MRRYACIVTGDRHATRREWEFEIRCVIDAAHPNRNTLIILHGAATGIDTVADEIIRESWPEVALLPFPADRDAYGRSAGPRRNRQMLELLSRFGEAGYDCRVLAFHNFIDNSKGTADMVKIARQAGFPVSVIRSRE